MVGCRMRSCNIYFTYMLIFVAGWPVLLTIGISSNYYKRMTISKESFNGNTVSNIQGVRSVFFSKQISKCVKCQNIKILHI